MASTALLQQPAAPARRPVVDWPGHWLLGPLAELRDDQLETFLRMAKAGDAVRFRVLHRRIHLLTAPEQVGHVLVENVKNYGKQTRGYAAIRGVVGNGLLTSEGSFWLRQRRISQPAFHKKRIEAFGEVMAQSSARLADGWTDGQSIDVAHEMMGVTLQIVGLTLLSKDVGGHADAVGDALTTGLQHVMYRMNTPWAPPSWMPTARNRKVRAALTTLDDLVNGVIAERRGMLERQQDVPDDLLSMLMRTKDEDTGEAMSDAQLRDELLTLILAGHETTAMALSWTIHLLSKHPEIEEAVRAEIVATCGERLPGMDDLRGLALTDRVIQESMRLYPPAWMLGRNALADDDIAGHPVKAGDWVFMSPWVTHRRPDLWPDPERFDPDRFLPEAVARRPRFAYFPFSAGQRKCIGDQFAKMEAVLVLATLMQRARFERVPGANEPIPEPLVTLRPKGGLPMRVRRI